MDAVVKVARSEPPKARDEDAVAGESSAVSIQAVSQIALIGIFLIALIAALSIARSVVMPVAAAIIVGVTIGGPLDRLKRIGAPSWIVAIAAVGAIVALVLIVATVLATPISEWLSQAPDLTAKIQEKLRILGKPLGALQQLSASLSSVGGVSSAPLAVRLGDESIVQNIFWFFTPAIGELGLFFGALLFFLLGRTRLKGRLVLSFVERSHRLMALKIIAAAERDLATYLKTATVINLGVGVCAAIILFALGVPSAPLWGLLAFMLNYLPYVGPTIMLGVMLILGLVTFPTLSQGLLPAICFVCLTTLEGQILSPTLLGRRLELNPLAVFLGMAFWTWLWGAVGAFISVPALVIGMVAWRHMFPRDVVELP